MVSTRARKGSGSQAALAFKSTKRARGGGGAVKLAAASKRKKSTNATKARPLIEWPAQAKLVREEAEGPDPAADVDDDGPEPSEDTVVVEYDDLIQGEDEDAESPETEEGDDYESLRRERIAQNREMMSSLGISSALKAAVASSAPASRPRRRRAQSERPASPQRRSSRAKSNVQRFGDFLDEAAVQAQLAAVAAAARPANKIRERRIAKPRTRALAHKQTEAKKVYKKVLRAEDLHCSPLSPDKLAWAWREMATAYATEVGIADVPPMPTSVRVSGTALMSTVMETLGGQTLPGLFQGQGGTAGGSYKSPCSYFGAPSNVAVGDMWLSRVECSQATVHGPWVGGISGSGKTGAYSIVLSGGYEGDIDEGDVFTYTGSGGRDLTGNKRTAPQSADQVLKKGNLAILVNMFRGKPLRVVRGYKLPSEYAPQQGYRYDGLYDVVEVWPEQGPSGFVIWRYKMQRVESADQPEAPWKRSEWQKDEEDRIQAMEDARGGDALIPVGTGTLGLSKEFKDIQDAVFAGI